MRFESEVMSEEILPAVRKIIAESLHQDYGHTQEEIANVMDLTQPAVSQYLKGKRADSDLVEKLKDDPQVQLLIEDAVSNAARNKSFVDEMAEIVRTGRDKGLFREKFESTERVL
ncbi:MAG: putative transcriptional regulator [Candidatus Nanohaloarchaea archaeon]|jgi:predicted transcriptional regulator